MEVILLEKVTNLGNLGDRVKVRAGYGRNYLIPSGKATPATEEQIRLFEERRAALEQAAAGALGIAQARAETLAGMVVTVRSKAGEEGRLFGSVGTSDIAEAITAKGIEVKRSEVRLPEGSFRQTGEYVVELQLHSDVDVEITLVIEPE